MNGIDFIADTNVLIGLFNGNERIGELLDNKVVAISYITEIELLKHPGLKAQEITLLRKLLRNFHIVEMNSLIKEETILISRKCRLKLPDAIIGATANVLSLPLVTLDDDFLKAADFIDILFYKV